jgi:hypothetical protein
MAALFAAGWLLVLAAGSHRLGYGLLLGGIVVMSLGECIYDSVRTPLIADLAPEGLGGRYQAAAGFSWQLGFHRRPGGGSGAPRHLPDAVSLTPRRAKVTQLPQRASRSSFFA